MTKYRGPLSSVASSAAACFLSAALAFACSSSTPSSPSSAVPGAGDGGGSAAGAGGGAGAGAGAGAGGASAGDAGAASLSSVTFHRDLEPILQHSCQSCHVPGGIAPFPLLTYADALANGAPMIADTQARIMPPWHAANTDECTVPFGWKDDTRLSDEQIATFQAWRDGGYAEGDPNDAPPPRQQATGLPGVQLELKPAAAFTVAPGADEFRCFVLDPKLVKDSYVNGLFVVPGNSAVVHHVLIFTDPKRESLANADSSMSYDCFGSAHVADSDLLAAWTPGGVPLEYPSNIAATVTAGSLLVMQVHYHPHSATDSTTDATTLQLRFGDQAPAYEASTHLIGNFKSGLPGGDGLLPGPDDPASGVQFIIPAGAKAHTETMQWTFKAAGTAAAPQLYAIGGHMHYVGVDEKITLDRADGTSACLMQIPNWDFDWQRRYDYDAPIDKLLKINAGDKLGIRCTYDNTMANEHVAESLTEQGLTAPHDVVLGETTLDEMCLAMVTTITPAK